MNNDNEFYEPDILSVTDDNGNEILFELLERYETEDNVYVAITEYHDDAEEIERGGKVRVDLRDVDALRLGSDLDLPKLRMKTNTSRFPIFLWQRLKKIMRLNTSTLMKNNI